jgi:hypothetical protein
VICTGESNPEAKREKLIGGKLFVNEDVDDCCESLLLQEKTKQRIKNKKVNNLIFISKIIAKKNPVLLDPNYHMHKQKSSWLKT